MRRIIVIAVLACLGLAGCSPAEPGPGTPSAPASSPSPTPSLPTVAPPPESPAGSPGSTTVPSPATSVPPVAGALDVSGHDLVEFASPSGRIWCGMRSDFAVCQLPAGYTGTVPDSEKVCPGMELDVTGITVDAKGTGWICTGDPVAMPVKGEPQVAWHTKTGYGFVTHSGFQVAVLPYGKTLRHGGYVCRSDETGVVCGNTRTGHGFNVARAGIAQF